MGASPEQLEREIETTREELAETIDEIGAKVQAVRESVAPRNLIRRRGVQLGLGGLVALVALLIWRKSR